MQGQRGSIGSLPENLVFDHGSSSSGAGIDQQICWNNMRDSPQNLADCVLSPSETNIRFINSSSQERQSLNGWIVEPSSSVQNQDGHNEIKMENGWSSSTSACAGAGPVAEEQQNEAINILSLDNVNVALGDARIANGPLFQQTSSLSSTHGVNINPGFAAHGLGNCLPMECPSASEDMQIPSAGSSSGQFGMPSGSGGYLMEENDCRRDCSLEGRRSSCKRKTLEGNVGQSSSSGSSNYLHPEGGLWHAALPQCNIGSSSSMSAPSGNNPGGNTLEQVNARLGIGVGVAASETPVSLSAVRSTGSSRRNFRLRINASHQQESIYDNVLPTGSAIEHSSGSAPRLFPIGSAVENSSGSSSRLFPINSSRETGSAPAADDTIPQVQPVVVRIPPLQRSLQTSRWSGRSSSRPGSSSASVISGERDAAPDEDSNSRSMLRNISDHPLFVPPIGTRSSVHNPTNWSSTGGTAGSVRNVASTSRTGSSSGFHPSSAPNWIPHRSPPRYPRRLSELVRRSLLSSAGSGSESGGQSSNYSTQHSGPSASSQEMALPSDAGQGHNLTPSRSAMLLERQLEGAFGIPFSLQTLAAASEGRSRLVSEIRNVLDLMRRGEGLRFEDVMILDQSVFFGMADVHDRHRDMRLDIDNMSYEELLALEERIGDVCTGLSGETILKRLKQRKYRCIATGDRIQSEPCCICQEEYNNGEDLGILDCGHDFHSECIKQWLMHKNLCPICKMAGLSKT